MKKYRNPILRDFDAACREWHAASWRAVPAWPARQRAYKRLMNRHAAQVLRRWIPVIRDVLDRVEGL